jgi:uncharacterized protein involved in exopolysaccharide biosynthesis
MNLFAIAGSFRRYKWSTIPVVLLTVFGLIYILAVQPPSYASKAFVLLENPPNVGQVHLSTPVDSNNPLASLENLVQVADVLSQIVTSPAETQELEQKGASAGYLVAPDSSLETPPAIDITGVGPTPQAAITSAQLVADAVKQELNQLQAAQHVNKTYLITSIEYVTPTSATSSSKSKIRSAAVVLAIGVILLLVAVSVAQSAQERRKRAKPESEWEAPESAASPEPYQYSTSTPNSRDMADNMPGVGRDQGVNRDQGVGRDQLQSPRIPAGDFQEFNPYQEFDQRDESDIRKAQRHGRWP